MAIDCARVSAGTFKLRKFSALSKDETQLYVPLMGSAKLLRVSADGITFPDNGTNADCYWVEHPNLDPEAEPFDYKEADPKTGLATFERLIVGNLACRVPEMQWFVAMEECLFPYLREVCHDRVITHHEGPTGSGKTSGAELPCLLLGLEPTGDTTAAVLNRIGDCGLLVMDNKEQANMKTGFTDFVLFLATPTLRARCSGDGYRTSNRHRPVGVLTSIEGAYKAEAIDRLVEISFNAHERDRATFDKRRVRAEIKRLRNVIVSALMVVLRRYFQIEQERRAIPVPKELERFGENFIALVVLLFAYADVAGKPSGWADSIIDGWKRAIQSRERDGDEVEYHVTKFLRLNGDDALSEATGNKNLDAFIVACKKVTYGHQTGSLTVTTCDQLLDWLKMQDRYNESMPKNSRGLGKRLRSVRSQAFQVLDEDSGLKELRRTKAQRFIGFFEPDDEQAATPKAAAVPVQVQKPVATQPHPLSKPPVPTTHEVFKPQTNEEASRSV